MSSAITLPQARGTGNALKYTKIEDPGDTNTFDLRGRSGVYVPLVSSGVETRTLAIPPAVNDVVMLQMMTDEGDITVTVTNGFDEADGGSDDDIVFSAAGQYVLLIGIAVSTTANEWRVVSYDGVTGPALDFATVTADTLSLSGTLAVTGTSTQAAINATNIAASGTLVVTGTTTHTGGTNTLAILLPNANTTILAANSGKIHYISNLSADRTFTLPPQVAGLCYEFHSTMEIADNFDWIIVADDAADFLFGGVLWCKSNVAEATASEVTIVVPNGTDDHTIQVITPSVGTWLKFYCDGTNWRLTGFVMSTDTPTYT